MHIYSVNDLLRPLHVNVLYHRGDPVGERVSPRESENGVRTGNTGRELALTNTWNVLGCGSAVADAGMTAVPLVRFQTTPPKHFSRISG